MISLGVRCIGSGTYDVWETRCREPDMAATLGSAQFAAIDRVDGAVEVIGSTPTHPDVWPARGLSARMPTMKSICGHQRNPELCGTREDLAPDRSMISR